MPRPAKPAEAPRPGAPDPGAFHGPARIDFRVYLITDRKQAPGGDIAAVVDRAVAGGIRAVQLREKDLSGRELYLLAGTLREITAAGGARLLINDRADVAKAVGADGVHLGVSSIPTGEARRFLGPEALIGRSTHTPGELMEAQAEGADFVTFGPVFATPSKAAYGPPVGISALAGACRAARIPVFALGGIGRNTVDEAIAAGAHGIALISAVVAAPDPGAAAAELTARLTREGR